MSKIVVSENQFIKLYSNDSKENLLGWFCIYKAPERALHSYVQHWAFIKSQDSNLRGLEIFGEASPDILIENREQWINELKNGPEFKSFIRRKCYHRIKPDGMHDFLDCLNLKGNIGYSISLEGKKDWLVLKEEPRVFGHIINYYQVSVLSTLETLDGSCFSGKISFSDDLVYEKEIQFSDFYNNNVQDQVFTTHVPSEIKYSLLEEVTKIMLPPSEYTIPED